MKASPGVVITSPVREQPFVEGQVLKVVWQVEDVFITKVTVRLLTECAEAYQEHVLETSLEINLGHFETTLPYVREPFITTVEIVVHSGTLTTHVDAVPIFIRPEQSCAPGCLNRFVGDEVCQPECFVMACEFDEGDCCDLKKHEYPDVCVGVMVSTWVEDYGEEMSWELVGSCPGVYAESNSLKRKGPLQSWRKISRLQQRCYAYARK